MGASTIRTSAAIAALMALLLASCNGEEEEQAGETPDGQDDELISITVGDVAGIPSSFLSYAVDEGFFEAEGLDVTVEVSPGGAANIPGVESGDYEIAGSNIVSVLLARQEGLQLQIVSAGTSTGEDPDDDYHSIVVPGDSDIQEPSDLEGRSVAVNTRANISELGVRFAAEQAGIDPDSVDYVEIGYPDIVPALSEGQVDAALLNEPFQSIAFAQDMRPIIRPFVAIEPGLSIGSYFSSDTYIEENPDVIDSFIAGTTAAGEHIAENHDEFRDALVDHGGLDPEVAENVYIPNWGGAMDRGFVEMLGELVIEYDFISEAPSVDEVVY